MRTLYLNASIRPGWSLALAMLLAIPFVFFTTFNGVSWFDDEGTLLVGFQSLRDGHVMYDQIYSLYGPLYNALYGLIYVILGVPLNHTAARLISVILWLGYTAGFAAFCYKVTRSIPAMLVGFLLTLTWLAQLMESPGHPEEICLILLATLLLQCCAIDKAPGIKTFASIGAAAVALALVKINVGAYVGGAVLLVLLRATFPSRWTRVAISVVTIGMLLLPIAVQVLLVDFEWVKQYILFATLTIGASLLVLTQMKVQYRVRKSDWLAMAIAAGLTFVMVIGGVMLAGRSARAMLEAVLLQNAHFIRSWYLPLHLDLRSVVVAGASVLAAVAFCVSGYHPSLRRYRAAGVLILKCYLIIVGGVDILLAQSHALFTENQIFIAETHVFLGLTPFCWIVMVTTEPRPPIGRVAAALFGSMMVLYPFPVAGHQINIGALLAVLMLPMLAGDVLNELSERARCRGLSAAALSGLVSSMVLGFGCWVTVSSALIYMNNVPLGLPGTGPIRTDDAKVATLRWVTDHLSSCKSLYSLPGMYSFNLWAGLPLVTSYNINDILAFISPAQQDDIVQSLSRQPGLCIVYNPSYLLLFDRGQVKTDPPLLHYIMSDFSILAERKGFQILRRSSPTVAPLQIGAAASGANRDGSDLSDP